jgi:hypothetical protein
MTPSQQNERSADSPKSSISSICKLMAICAVLLVFGGGLFSKSFVDEYAYITQSYYTDLMLEGRFNDKAWLELYAYDLQPLPKYLIGLSLHLARFRLPVRGDAFNWYYWDYKSVGDYRMLAVARVPFVLLGVAGCIAIFGCGVLLKDTRVGGIAAALLVLNPLYRLHAHRAMSDVPCEALMIAALAIALWVGRRIWCGRLGAIALLGPFLAGVAAGGALLCKFNGFLGLLIIGSWCAAACVWPGLSVARKLALAAATAVTFSVAIVCFVALNPYLTARPVPSGVLANDARQVVSKGPWQRFLAQVDHRLKTSEIQRLNFPHNALDTLAQKSQVFLIQGFGRFGPLGPFESDSTVRFSSRQDWGAVLWLPLVLFGLVETIRLCGAQLQVGGPPTAGAVVIWAALAWLTVACYLPMAWDRYLLPIQSGNALLAAVGASALWDRLAGRGAASRGRA